MMTFKKSAIIFLLLVSITAGAQVNVTKAEGNLPGAEASGFFYNLPRTGIVLDIAIEKITRLNGPYREFADKYLGISDVIESNSVAYRIKSLSLSSYTEPDPAQYYFVSVPAKAKKRKPLEMFASESGYLDGVRNGHPKNEGGSGKQFADDQASIPEIANPTLFERVDTITRWISVDSISIEQKVFRKTSAAKTPEQKAKEAADFVLKLDESMFNLINGYQEVNYEKGTIEFMYNQMRSLRDEYLQLFKGITGVRTELRTVRFIPVKSTEPSVFDVGKFTTEKGLTARIDKGDMLTIKVISLSTSANAELFADVLSKGNSGARGIYYRIPEQAIVQVLLGNKVLLETQMTVNQMGVVSFLPASAVSKVELNGKTGAISHVELE